MANYHTHITIPSGVPVPSIKGWKKTEIILFNTEVTQVDTMLTKHYKLGYSGNKCYCVDDIVDEAYALSDIIGATRVKVEEDFIFTTPSQEHYVEIHAKMDKDTGESLLDPKMWVRSKNPKDMVDGKLVYFFNRRLYEYAGFKDVIEEALMLPAYDLKIEQLVYDSNPLVDRWWA